MFELCQVRYITYLNMQFDMKLMYQLERLSLYVLRNVPRPKRYNADGCNVFVHSLLYCREREISS